MSGFLKQKNPTLQSFTAQEPDTPSVTPDNPDVKPDDILDMTEEELAKFEEPEHKHDESTTQHPPSSDGSDIVVTYSSEVRDRDHSPLIGMSTDYSTMNELAMEKERKEKKRQRVSSKVAHALRPGSDVNGDGTSEEEELGGLELGFKPQFRSNPLQRVVPPTPPPTPATGTSASASATSEECKCP